MRAMGYEGRRVGVFGLARSGIATARALADGGATVVAWDDNPRGREAAAKAGIGLLDLSAADLRGLASLVLSPGVPLTHPEPHPVVRRARDAGVEIVGDIEVFARAKPEARLVGVTGTNGKSTTTALIGHILRESGRRVEVGGNIGTPIMDLARLGADGVYVLELSSFQIDLCQAVDCDVAVLLNISPDHIDRHGSMEGYIAVKRRLFAMQRAGRVAVVGCDDAWSRETRDRLIAGGRHRVVPISAEAPVAGGVFVREGYLVDSTGGVERRIVDLASAAPRLPGRHNWQNISAAYAAVRALGVVASDAVAAIASFPGLAHRLEFVGEAKGVAFVNDSKATNADAAARALDCYRDIYWIAGGRPKEGGIEPLRPYFERVRRAYLVGEAAEGFAATLGSSVPHVASKTLDRAVADAFRDARRDGAARPVVLLSPACASYDQFANFEARGDAFRAHARALIGSEDA